MAIEVIEVDRSRAVLRLSSDQIALLASLVVHSTGRMLRIEDLEARVGVSESEISELAGELVTILHRVSNKPVDEPRKDIRHIGLYGTEDDHATIDVTVDQVGLLRAICECTFGRLEESKDTHTLLGFWPDEVQTFIDELGSVLRRMASKQD